MISSLSSGHHLWLGRWISVGRGGLAVHHPRNAGAPRGKQRNLRNLRVGRKSGGILQNGEIGRSCSKSKNGQFFIRWSVYVSLRSPEICLTHLRCACQDYGFATINVKWNKLSVEYWNDQVAGRSCWEELMIWRYFMGYIGVGVE